MVTAILTHVYVGMNDTYIDECTGMFALRLALSFAYVGALARLRVFLRLCPAFTRACAMMSHMHSHRSNGCHAMDDPWFNHTSIIIRFTEHCSFIFKSTRRSAHQSQDILVLLTVAAILNAWYRCWFQLHMCLRLCTATRACAMMTHSWTLSRVPVVVTNLNPIAFSYLTLDPIACSHSCQSVSHVLVFRMCLCTCLASFVRACVSCAFACACASNLRDNISEYLFGHCNYDWSMIELWSVHFWAW